MDEYMREDMIRKVEKQQGRRAQLLAEFKIPSSAYYKWRKAYDEGGISGLAKTKPGPKRSWNRLTASEENKVLEVAILHPELSPRLLAIQITDQEDFSISESTVYRILKENNLIAPRPLPEMPAAKEWTQNQKAGSTLAVRRNQSLHRLLGLLQAHPGGRRLLPEDYRLGLKEG